ncbi:general transcription factor IIH subunit 3 isoform X2 [Patagioenas fasciata]|uniref:general transcription factor IIH subunit 3 isoform X2 n=1 Tax=Patagioenas fasciata TaxID=372321 RepID=UPI003A9A50D3
MKRRKSSPPEDTATDESTRDSVSMAARRLLLSPWMVSPAGRGGGARSRGRPRGPHLGLRGDPDPPRSCLRKPSSARMAATAEATSGSSLSCALKVSIRSVRERGARQARPGAAPPARPRSRYRPCSWPLRSPPRLDVTRPVWMTTPWRHLQVPAAAAAATGAMSGDDELSLLVVVIDTNPIWWGKKALGEAEFTLSKCIDAVMVLGNSHLLMNRNNKLAVIASHTQESRFLYPGKHWAVADLFGDGGGSMESNCSGSRDGKYELLTAINDAIAEEIKDLMTKTEMKGQQTETQLAGSLAKALCYINRMSKEVKANQEIKSRILVIKAAEDSALQYMNFMNVIFAAQKQSVLIDACVLESDSGLLQQACDITGGIYLKVLHMPSLLQYLLWVFLPDQEQRSQLVLPPPIHVDYRAACFCHRNLIEIGYVCSVCLSRLLSKYHCHLL